MSRRGMNYTDVQFCGGVNLGLFELRLHDADFYPQASQTSCSELHVILTMLCQLPVVKFRLHFPFRTRKSPVSLCPATVAFFRCFCFLSEQQGLGNQLISSDPSIFLFLKKTMILCSVTLSGLYRKITIYHTGTSR